MKTSAVLKSLAIAVVLSGGCLLGTGCTSSGLEWDVFAPPAVSSGENASRIWRYAAFDWSQAIDDVERTVTMTRPASRMTRWNLRQSD